MPNNSRYRKPQKPIHITAIAQRIFEELSRLQMMFFGVITDERAICKKQTEGHKKAKENALNQLIRNRGKQAPGPLPRWLGPARTGQDRTRTASRLATSWSCH